MATALLQEARQASSQTHRAEGDALRAPRVSVVGRQQTYRAQDVLDIVERLALPHEHDVGETVPLRQRVYLVHYVGHREVAAEALPASHAELAAHPAADLSGDAERCPVVVGNEDGLDMAACLRREKVLDRAVG